MIDRRTMLALTGLAGWGLTVATRQPVSRASRSADFGILHDDATDNTGAIAAMSVELVKRGVRELVWSRGVAQCRRPFLIPDGLRIVAESETSGIRNVAEGPDNLRSPLLIGNWHPAHLTYHSRELNGNGDERADILLLRTRDGVNASAESVILANPAAAALLRVGSIHAVVRRESNIQRSTGVALRIPIASSLVRVVAADRRTGRVDFDGPIGFTSPTPIELVWIDDNARDWVGLPIGFADKVSIEGLSTYGFTSIGTVCASAFECSFRDLGGEVVTPVMMNSLTRSTIDGWRGTFTGARAIEIKFGHHDGIIRNIDLRHRPVMGEKHEGAMFSIGEYCRTLTVDTFSIDAPQWDSGILFQLQPGTNCLFRNGRVRAPQSRQEAVIFYGDPSASLQDTGLDNVTIRHGSNVHISVAEGDHEAERCFVRNSNFSTADTGPILAIAVRGGRNCEITDNVFDRGEIEISGYSAKDNVIRDNLTNSPIVRGVGIAQNRVGRNYFREPSGRKTAFFAQ